jgi:uncharacterized protein YecT (DUF1311 family)
MWNRMTIIIVSLFFLSTSTTYAVDFQYKKISSFKKLESFEDVDDFESSYEDYIQVCLDNTFGGSGGIPCFIGYEMWDRELNIYYEKLMKILGANEKKLLKDSQLIWIQEREKSVTVNSAFLDRKYSKSGTMYQLMRAQTADSMVTPIVKQRALLLKDWYDFLSNPDDKE